MAKLIRPEGITRPEADRAARTIAAYVADEGGGKRDLASLLRAAGLLPDPEARSGSQLGFSRSHPFGTGVYQ